MRFVILYRAVLSLAPNGLGLQHASLLQRSAVPHCPRRPTPTARARRAAFFQTRAAGSLSVRRVSGLLPASLQFRSTQLAARHFCPTILIRRCSQNRLSDGRLCSDHGVRRVRFRYGCIVCRAFQLAMTDQPNEWEHLSILPVHCPLQPMPCRHGRNAVPGGGCSTEGRRERAVVGGHRCLRTDLRGL